MKLLLATRGSQLALWQARETERLLRARHPGLEVELVVVQSSGDRDQRSDLSQLGRTGVFTVEIDDAVLSGRAQAGVHSLKDMTTSLPAGLALASVLARAGFEDALLSRDGHGLEALPPGARVATGSVRRVALLKRARPDLELVGIRGNVDTRLEKLRAGQAEALIMARAGLDRLGLTKHITELLGPPRFLPAVGQGIVGLTCRDDDSATRALLETIRDESAWVAAHAERALLAKLHGGCNAPLGALARTQARPAEAVASSGTGFTLRAVVLSLDGREAIEDEIGGSAHDAVALAQALAERLSSRGAARLIEDARRAR